MSLSRPRHAQRTVLGAALVSTLAVTAQAEELGKMEIIGQSGSALIRTTDSTASKMDVSIKDTARSVVSVKKEFLDQVAVEDVSGAFDYVAAFRRNGSADRTFTARGIRTPISNIMVDGLRTLQGGEGGTGSRMPSTFNAEAVTFLRGPAGLLYGSGAGGGLVNIETRKPQAEQATTLGVSGRSYVSDDTGNFERNGLTFNLDTTGSLVEDKVMYRLIASEAPNRDMFQEGREEDESFLDAALTFKLSDSTSITPRFEYRDQERTGGSSYGDGVVGTYKNPGDRSRYYGSQDDYGKFKSKTAGLTLEHAFNENWKGRAVVRHNTSDSDAQDLYASTSFDPRTDGYIDRKYVRSSGRDEYNAFDANLQGKFEAAGVKHHMLAGVSYLKSEVGFFRSFQATADAQDQNLVNASNPKDQTVSAAPDWDIQYNDREATDTSIYLKDRISLGDFTLTGGLAYVTLEQSEDRSGSTYTDDYSETIWDLGLIYALNPNINLFANYSRAWEPVNARYAAQYGNGQSYEPVEGHNYEVGFKGTLLNGMISPSVTLFRLERDNSTSWGRDADGGYLLVQNKGTGFVSEGVEIDTLIAPTANWNMLVSYAYTDAADTRGDNKGVQADNTPRHSLSVWNNYHLNPQVKLGLGLRYEDERFDGGNTLESYVETDMGVYYSHQNWDASLVLRNAFDKVRTEDGANGDGMVLPNDPRSLNLSVNYSF